jgi:hypothetical protein
MLSQALVIFAALLARAAGAKLPRWTAARGDPAKPLGGWPRVSGASAALVYRATSDIGSYNHAAMLTYGGEAGDAPFFTLSWKNSPKDEDEPGQRILYSQSANGSVWTPTDGTNVLFPNISSARDPAALFAGPFAWVSGRLYASASPTQFCLWPDAYAPVLLLRRVYTNASGALGPAFWASPQPPPRFAPAARLAGVRNLTEVDAQAQADAAALLAGALPCDVPGGDATATKCEGCGGGGCQDWKAAAALGNERTHYTVPGAAGGHAATDDVLLYRSKDDVLYASLRDAPGAAAWGKPEKTDMPNDNSNINAGALPDGRVYLVSNAMPFKIRDPLVVATSRDGVEWDTARVAMTCTDLPDGSKCAPRYAGKAKNPGPSYPQAVAVPALGAVYVCATNNKEDVVVARLPLASL